MGLSATTKAMKHRTSDQPARTHISTIPSALLAIVVVIAEAIAFNPKHERTNNAMAGSKNNRIRVNSVRGKN